MEYHKDRFQDYSLIVLADGKWVAVLPANRVGNEVFSHQGLSYGTLIVQKDIRIEEYLSFIREIMFHLFQNKIDFISIKLLPRIYNKTLSDELDYISFLMDAKVYRSDIYMVIDGEQEYKPNRNRKRALKIAKELEIEIQEDNNYIGFWNEILIPNLKNRFDVLPVHSLDEITDLAKVFPYNIKLFNAYSSGVLKAGVVVFIMENVAHFQYSSGADDRNDTAALDVLFDFIIRKFSNKKYVSFGSSSENEGLVLNKGLAYWKESFGATATVQNFLKFETKNYKKLESFIL
jgi:protein associated with RNAse G/E